MDNKVLETHAEWTKPGSFHHLNGGCFKGQKLMTRDHELEYVRSALESEWIEHHGKGYPDLPMDTLVQLKFRDGDTWEDVSYVSQWSFCWRHEPGVPCDADIVAYRVVKS